MTPPSNSIVPADAKTTELVCSIANRFAVQGEFVCGEEINSGHINSTYRATYQQTDGTQQRYIIQAINRNVFKDPYAVMNNVEKVTRHINSRVLRLKKDLGGQTLNLFPAREGGSWIEDENGTVWRCYNNIEGCVTYDVVENTRQAYQAARAFGSFQDLVSDLPADKIIETIPNFHHTRQRYAKLMEVAAADPVGRLDSVRTEFDFIRERENLVGILLDLQASGAIPLRVTHNDTKINNVMLDDATGGTVAVIDLDTIMPGLPLYDFGEMVRTSASSTLEDDPEPANMHVRLPLFRALVQGYLRSAVGGVLNATERAHLGFSGKLMTYENGIRFLTDYLQGDIYYKIRHPRHNLDRCRTQFALVRSIEQSASEMTAIVAEVEKTIGR